MRERVFAVFERLAGRTSFLLLGLLAVGLVLAANFADFSWTLNGFRRLSGGIGILDTRWHYDAATAYHILDAQGERGRAAYMHMLWSLDLVIPISVSLWLGVAITLGVRRLSGGQGRVRNLVFLALLAGGMDLSENILVSVLLWWYPAHLDALAGLAGYVTSAKQLLYLSAVLTAVALPLFALRRARRVRCKARRDGAR